MSPKLAKKPARPGASISGATRMVKVARSPGFRLSFIGARLLYGWLAAVEA